MQADENQTESERENKRGFRAGRGIRQAEKEKMSFPGRERQRHGRWETGLSTTRKKKISLQTLALRGAQHLSHLSKLLAVNPQLAHSSPRCHTWDLLSPGATFVAWVEIAVAKYTKQAWMTTEKPLITVKGCHECVQYPDHAASKFKNLRMRSL